MVAEKTRKKIIDSFMALVAEQPWDAVTMAAVAERADVKLSALRTAYDGRMAMLGDFFRRIDAQVLDGVDEELADEPAPDRLFDVLMSRLDALAPHKAALRSIAGEVRCNPLFAVDINRLMLRSAAWMLTAADIGTSGLRGMARTQGLVVAFARVIRVWLDDEEPGQARTMAALDRELKRGVAMLNQLDRAGAALGSLGRFVDAARRRQNRDRNASTADAAQANPM